MHEFLKFIFEIKLYMFRTVPLSIIRIFFHCTHSSGICHTACEQDQDGTGSVLILLASCQQTCMTYTIAVYTVKKLAASSMLHEAKVAYYAFDVAARFLIWLFMPFLWLR